jgi:hypothetical protein
MRKLLLAGAVLAVLTGCAGVHNYNATVASNKLTEACKEGDMPACAVVLRSSHQSY